MNDPTEDEIRAVIYPVKKQGATFSEEARIDREASELEGHSVYANTVYVTVRAQGERDCISVPATKEHQLQFAAEWREFKERSAEAPKSDLRNLPTISKAVIRTLHELGVYTVEMLASAEIVDRVEVPELPDEDFVLPGVVPKYLAKWQPIAKHYLALKHFAIHGEKPRIKLEAA